MVGPCARQLSALTARVVLGGQENTPDILRLFILESMLADITAFIFTFGSSHCEAIFFLMKGLKRQGWSNSR